MARKGHFVKEIQANLTDDLRRPPWQGNPNPMAGHCYVASEAAYHLLGGKEAGLTPHQMHHEGTSHWFLRDKTGQVIDPTASQFKTAPNYDTAVGKGFLTGNKPSKRTRQLLSRIK